MDFHFVCPHGGVWDWRWPDGPGIPGSETAIVEITRRLARRGHDVTVYRHDGPEDMADDGKVRWRRPHRICLERPGEWWLCREPRLVDCFQGDACGRLHLRCDDLHYGAELTPARAEKLSSILCMSQWHRRHLLGVYPFLDPDKVVASGCGIASDRLKALPPVERDPYRIMWGSSYDRGIETALEVFRRAKRYEPRLNFHATYGWNGYDELEAEHGPGHPLVAMRRRVMSSDLSGVAFHGRISRARVWDLYASSSFLVYLTGFHETGAVAQQEAQALGCIPILSPLAALGEKGRGIFIDGIPTAEDAIDAAVETLLTLMASPELCREIRDFMIPNALEEFDWERAVDIHAAPVPTGMPTVKFRRPGGSMIEGPLRLIGR